MTCVIFKKEWLEQIMKIGPAESVCRKLCSEAASECAKPLPGGAVLGLSLLSGLSAFAADHTLWSLISGIVGGIIIAFVFSFLAYSSDYKEYYEICMSLCTSKEVKN